MKYNYAQKWTVYELSAIQKKGLFWKKVRFYFFKLFLYTFFFFCKKRTFCYPTIFIESLITHKRFIFEESYIW